MPTLLPFLRIPGKEVREDQVPYTSRMTSIPVIRPLRPSDREAVGRIAYQTGFFGESAARYFPAQPLFGELWTGPYFRQADMVGFVAVLDGQVVGYIVGTASQRAYHWGVLRTVLSAVWRTLPAPRALLACLRYLLRAGRFAPPHANGALYPAHLHINLLPQARGHHLGEQLLQTFLLALKKRGVPGVQLSTTTENRAALGLYHKFGFQVLVTQFTPLWTPWLSRPAEHVIMGRILERPGAADGAC